MKKVIIGILFGILITLTLPSIASTAISFVATKAGFPILINGKPFISEKPVVVINGSTYMPLKAIGEVLGVNVSWNKSASRVEIGSVYSSGKLTALIDFPEIVVGDTVPPDATDISMLSSYARKQLLFVVASRQELYDRIKNELLSRRTSFIIDAGGSSESGFTDFGTQKDEFETDDIVNNMLKQIFKEDPYLAAITNYNYQWSMGEVEFTCSYLESLNESTFVKAKVAQVLGTILKPGMTSLQKEQTINQWICENINYDNFLSKKSAFAALKSPYVTVCSGYTLLAYEMLTQAGIDCIIVSGKAFGNSSFSGAHMWNKVFIDNKWLHLDVTWNDTSGNYVSYFNKTDIEISKDHSW